MGGVFYLLPLLGRKKTAEGASIIDNLAQSLRLNHQPFHYIVYHFFQSCFATVYENEPSIGISSDDPVLRLLCACPTDEENYFNGKCEALKADEQQVIHSEVMDLLNHLQTLFAQRQLSSQELWTWLCRRHVQLQIDPVWVEVIYILEELDTDIRRAGLDLDPGYIPWMGKVVTLRYRSRSQAQGGHDDGK
ncbi:hypothetical protein AB835_00645 [Candidatus Endobugula sertula]|uniref:Uncharacterized protein n=1 Tax=Candidatus Endobugula sertula TaxID=62101 RepID=A0A1D2QTY5_9GAMM|nr:hypothetical protein AB835_00645 [Candidatus Endobugula sertula]